MTSHARAAALVLAALAALAGPPAARAQTCSRRASSPGRTAARGARELHALSRRRRAALAATAASPATRSSRRASRRGAGSTAGSRPRSVTCEGCHHEHQGRDFPLVDWGRAGQEGLRSRAHRLRAPRASTGGSSARAATTGGSWRDPAVLEFSASSPSGDAARRAAGLRGVPLRRAPRPARRASASAATARTAGSRRRASTTPARLPARGKARYGRVREVPPERARAGAALPPRQRQTAPVRARAFVRYKGLPFQRCTDCHKDPHQGRLGTACAGCHTPAELEEAERARCASAPSTSRRGTRSAGRTRRCACEACHGPWPGRRRGTGASRSGSAPTATPTRTRGSSSRSRRP